jgi:hypothetical protein
MGHAIKKRVACDVRTPVNHKEGIPELVVARTSDSTLRHRRPRPNPRPQNLYQPDFWIRGYSI